MIETIHIGLAIDKNFGAFAGITITSLVHNNIDNYLVVHIVHDGLQPEDMHKLQLMERLYRNLTIRLYHLDNTEDTTFVVPEGHITQAMYYRYMFARLLPSEVTRVLYLDADIICKGDLLPLWRTDLQGKVLAAVRDWGEAKSCVRIGLSSGLYFNSGVLLIDLRAWERQQLTARLFTWLEQNSEHKVLWGDQDALNAILDGEFVELPKAYNCIVVNDTSLKSEAGDVLLHYVDYVKPWHVYYMDCPDKELYWEYVRKSLWSELTPRDGHTVETVAISARLMYRQGRYKDAVGYYESILKYFLEKEEEKVSGLRAKG